MLSSPVLAGAVLAAALASVAAAQTTDGQAGRAAAARSDTSASSTARGTSGASRGTDTDTDTDNEADNEADKEADAPLVAKPVLRAGSLIRPVSGTAAAGPTRPRLDIVDAGREDVGPLATSLRADPMDQRLPTGFERVYRVPGSESLLMRGNGALFAVFEESVYRRSGAALPPGTVFHIGMPDLRPTGYGLGHPPSDVQPLGSSSAGRAGAIGAGPVDLRVRPARPGTNGAGVTGGTGSSRSEVSAPITLESALGIAPRASHRDGHASGTERVSSDAGPYVGFEYGGSVATVESDAASRSAQAARVASEAPSTPVDPYAYLRLGPARIARAD